ncbi:hypothetical protein [Erythrobacter sp. YT30]|uniref:hypothetical protein n=1 Tax=Erythrobacter sp. YT30 TaxID=1735012 RepID=UPI00076C2AEA|nr:hypothetical protein [Erythrobacter sp. YT30]KWV91036.1 hypothetical protein AUC45_06865 [Erythrobacter sp. YT30]
MAFISRFNPKAGVADFWSEFRKPNPYRWPMLAVSVLPIITIIGWAASESVYKTPESPQITYITTFDPDRTDAQIAASNAENQKMKDLREAEETRLAEQKREMYKTLGAASGFDVDKMEADAEAERAAEEAAKQQRLENAFGSSAETSEDAAQQGSQQ